MLLARVLLMCTASVAVSFKSVSVLPSFGSRLSNQPVRVQPINEHTAITPWWLPAAPQWKEVAIPALSYGSVALTAAAAAAASYAVAGSMAAAIVFGGVALPAVVSIGQFLLLGDGAYVARMMGGKPADARLVSIVHDVAQTANLDPPAHVFEIPTEEMNAFAAGIRRKGTAVAVTSGLRGTLNDQELRAVCAHEMGHLKNRDTASNMHLAATVAGLGGLYSTGRMLTKAERNNRSSSDKKDEGDGSVALLGLGLMGVGAVSQAVAHLLRLGVSRQHELKADSVAADLYGPETMISALRKIDAGAKRGFKRDALGARGGAFAHMYISNPGPTSALSATIDKVKGKTSWIQRALNLLSTHPSLEERVSALRASGEPTVRPAAVV